MRLTLWINITLQWWKLHFDSPRHSGEWLSKLMHLPNAIFSHQEKCLTSPKDSQQWFMNHNGFFWFLFLPIENEMEHYQYSSLNNFPKKRIALTKWESDWSFTFAWCFSHLHRCAGKSYFPTLPYCHNLASSHFP